MQGIALGRCRKSDGMIFYCPHNKQLYTSSDYKLDEGRHTPNTFNLRYDGGFFMGLYNHSSPTNSSKGLIFMMRVHQRCCGEGRYSLCTFNQ